MKTKYMRLTIFENFAEDDGCDLFNIVEEFFNDIGDLRTFLDTRYGDMVPELIDKDNEIIGYEYVYENSDLSHVPVETWTQVDQVIMTTIVSNTFLITELEETESPSFE